MHVVTHGTLHRDQVVGMLRQLGVKPPATDIVFDTTNRPQLPRANAGAELGPSGPAGTHLDVSPSRWLSARADDISVEESVARFPGKWHARL
jgi:hypothetical protein